MSGPDACERLFSEWDAEAPEAAEFHGCDVVAFSVRGPGKELNEDSACVWSTESGGVIAVADGMGGQAHGERASRIAVEALRRRLGARANGAALRDSVLDAIEDANREVLELKVGAGTTFAAAVVEEGTARAVHVGDAMVLHVGQRGAIKALTVPHTPVGYAVEAGLIAEEQAYGHRLGHVLINGVGQQDMRIELGAPLELAARDTLCVASDGLCDNLTTAEIVEIVRKGPLEESAAELMQRARARMAGEAGTPSKPDDLTFLLLRPTGDE
jgi:serine/threonine protein phosphatase PrpC